MRTIMSNDAREVTACSRRPAATIFSAIQFLGIAAAAILWCSSADAQCIDEVRKVKVDKDATVVRLRSYLCKAGEESGAERVKVEFFRLSDSAASLVLGKVTSAGLRKTVGTPKVWENEVFRTFMDLLNKKGITTRIIKGRPDRQVTGITIISQGEESVGGDFISGKAVKTLLSPDPTKQSYFPPPDEIAALKRKTIPENLNFFYRVQCQDEDTRSIPPWKGDCRKYDPSKADLTFWRGIRLDDVVNYSANVKKVNALLRSTKQKDLMPNVMPDDLRLLQYLAGSAVAGGFGVHRRHFQPGWLRRRFRNQRMGFQLSRARYSRRWRPHRERLERPHSNHRYSRQQID
jgi:hypothetical protein